MSSQANQIKKNARNLTIFGSILIGFMVLLVVFIILQDPNKKNFSSTITVEPLEEIEKNANSTSAPAIVEVVDDFSLAAAKVSGGNLITPDDRVINTQGQVVQNSADPMTTLAPKLTAPVNADNLAESVIKLEAYPNGFSPREFRVLSGQSVTLAVTAIDAGTRLVFDDVSLAGLEMAVSAGQTRIKTFNAPLASGLYVFRQDIPGRYEQVGRMIVE
jgi:hypothetical protein